MQNVNVSYETASDRSKLRDILHFNWLVIFKIINVIKDKHPESPRSRK